MRKQDIKQVLTMLGAHTFKDSGESIQTNCVLAPWTHSGGTDRRPSLGVKEQQGMSYCHCFTCGHRGGMIGLVREYAKYALPEGVITQEDVKKLVDFIFIAEDEEVENVPELVEMPKPSDSILKSIGVWHDYFEERGIDKSTFDLWRLGYYEADQRIMFPVYDNLGKEIVGFVGRTIVKDEPVKYNNYPHKFKKSAFLYGLHMKTAHTQKLIVVEGPIDAVRVNHHLMRIHDKTPFFLCVALMGSEPSAKQMDLMVENANEVICMLDNDSSGKKGQKDLINGIGKRTIVSIVEYPDDVNDPDQAGEKVLDMIENRLYSTEYQIRSFLGVRGNG